jgi:uncharacterized protein YcfL
MKKTILFLAIILASCSSELDVPVVLNDYLFTQSISVTKGITNSNPVGMTTRTENKFKMLQITEKKAIDVCKEKTYTKKVSDIMTSSVTTFVAINK